MDRPESARKRILVVDDDPDARTIHASLLAHAGYDVLDAASGRAALDILQRYSPDLVLVDLKMPDLDGWQLLELLRNNASTRDIAIVALTIVGRGEDRRDPVRRGFDDHWVKPIRATDLLARTERLIGPPEPAA